MMKAMGLAFPLLCVLFDGIVLAVPPSPDSVLQTMSMLPSTLKPVRLSSCYKPFIDLRDKGWLDFSVDKNATRSGHSIGNNSQLQCVDDHACSSSGYLRSAHCYNQQFSYSDSAWDCYGDFPNPGYQLDQARIDCEHSSSEFCVLEDSCILLYSSYKVKAEYLFFLVFPAIVLGLFFILIGCKYRRFRGFRNTAQPPVAAGASRTPATQISYNAAADAPPSYSTLERDPRRFEKPTIRIIAPTSTEEQPSVETPPPSYDTISSI